MKIYGDHEKNLSLYESITRSRKRSVYLYFILAGVFTIFLFFCHQKWYFYATFGLLAVGFFALTFFTYYYLNRYPKKVKIFDEILEDYKSNKIIRELSKRGLRKDNLDCVISPYRYIRIAYVYSEELYYEIRIESTRHGFSTELTPKFVMQYPKRDIVRYFSLYLGKFKYVDNTKEMTKKQFYAWCYDVFSNESLMDDIKQQLAYFKGIKSEVLEGETIEQEVTEEIPNEIEENNESND